MEDGIWLAHFCLKIEGVEMVEKVGANTNKCHKPKQSKTPKPKTPPNPKQNLWAGTMAKEFHQRLSYFFCATNMLLLARGALMLFIGPLLQDLTIMPYFKCHFLSCKPQASCEFTSSAEFNSMREYHPYPDFSFFLYGQESPSITVFFFFFSWAGEIFLMNGIFSLVNKQ